MSDVVGLFIVTRDGPGYLFFDSPYLFDDANRIQLSVPEELREQHEGISGRGGTLCGMFQAVIRKDGEVASRMISVEYLRLKVDRRDPDPNAGEGKRAAKKEDASEQAAAAGSSH